METLFVSSTFQDMQSERDAIRDIVLPRLNAEAQEYGQSVAVCDLRWGINTQDLDDAAANWRVLDICLDEIDQSASPMIVVLGDRYGWIPPADLIRTAAEQKQIRLDDPQISVTALEIEYGTRIHQDNTLFYFRERGTRAPDQSCRPEDQMHRDKLEKLKSAIIRQYRGSVHTFREGDVQRFADMVYEDTLRVLKPKWLEQGRKRSPERAEQEKHWAYIREKGSSCHARMAQVSTIVDEIRGGERSIVIRGRPGSGKSTLLSKIALILSEYNLTVIPVACGLTEETSTAMGVLRQLVYRLELELRQPHPVDQTERDVQVWRGRLNELCAMFEKRGRELVIMVDAVDQLMRDEDRDRMIFLPGGAVHTVVTCLPDIVCQANREFVLTPIGPADKRAVIWRMLEQHHRELPDNVIGELLEKEASDTPLYLSLMLQRLMMMGKEDFDVINRRGGNMEEISRYQTDMIRSAPDSLEKMGAELMRTAGEKIGRELVQKVNEYIALSRYGLRESDLALLLGEKWNYLVFRQMINYMRESYMRREDGRYDFTHQSIRRGILEACGDQMKRHFEIWSALHQLDSHDPIRISEIVYHCMMAKEYNSRKCFLSYIYSFDVDVLKGAANCVHAASMLDGGEWIGSLFENAEQYGKPNRVKWLPRFFDAYCRGLFLENYTENTVKLRILQHECGLIDRLAADDPELAKMQMEYYHVCAVTAKEAGDDSRKSYTEKYFSAGKKRYQEGSLDHESMWIAYYNTVTLLKDAPDRKCWERAVEVGEEAIHSGLLEQLLEQNADLGFSLALFGSMGETYQRLGDRQKCLEAYRKDLELRGKNAERHPTGENLYFAGGAYYNVGNALMALSRVEEACSYYEKAMEMREKYSEAGKKTGSGIFAMKDDFNTCDNYANALFLNGLNAHGHDLLEKSFAYKKKAVAIYRCYTREEHSFPDKISRLFQDLGRTVLRLMEKDYSSGVARLAEMSRTFDDILTEDEGRLVLNSAMVNMEILEGDYQGIFRALKDVPGSEELQKRYLDRCRGGFLQYFDNRIAQAQKDLGLEKEYRTAVEYYNKSLGLLHLEHPAFQKEMLELAEKSLQMLAPLEQSGDYNSEYSFWAKEVTAFCHAGNCYKQAGDHANMLRCRKAAVDRQTIAARIAPSAQNGRVLMELIMLYESQKSAVGSAPSGKPSAHQKPSPPTQPKPEIYIREDGAGTIRYPDGSVFKGALSFDKRHGTGTLVAADGKETYKGQWQNDLKHGYGEITYPSGASYCGEWKEDRICGYGIRTDIYGKKTCGQWQDGVLVKSMSELAVKWKLNSIRPKTKNP